MNGNDLEKELRDECGYDDDNYVGGAVGWAVIAVIVFLFGCAIGAIVLSVRV